MKKRFLVCGDLHTKHDIFLKAINKFETEKIDLVNHFFIIKKNGNCKNLIKILGL